MILQQHSIVREKLFLKTKFGLWVMRVRAMTTLFMTAIEQYKKVSFYFKLKKAGENRDGDLVCHVLSLIDALAHFVVSGILTIEKWVSKF